MTMVSLDFSSKRKNNKKYAAENDNELSIVELFHLYIKSW